MKTWIYVQRLSKATHVRMQKIVFLMPLFLFLLMTNVAYGQKNNDFALNLFRQARDKESQVLSPLSITYALGMLDNGAAGKTQQEINDVLGFGKAGAEAINAFCRKMLTESGNLDKETKVKIANTIYVNKDYELQAPFVKKAFDYYDATPETRDFNDGKTMDVINQWASDHTEGMIKEILNEDNFNPFAVSYLLNAIYFNGEWTFKFDPDNTLEEPFNGGSNVFMMWQKSMLDYAVPTAERQDH